MAVKKKTINTNAVDESFLLASMRGDANPIPEPTPALVPEVVPVPVSVPESAPLPPPPAPVPTPASVFVEPLQNRVVVIPVEEESGEQVPVESSPKEDTRSKLEKQKEYESLFFNRDSNFSTRLGKPVCIRKEYHDRIQKIVQIIADNEVSIIAYVDNVLAHHFNAFQTEITHAYKKKVKDIF
jgi:hypothetical protein